EGNVEFKAQSISTARQRYEQALELLDLRKLGDGEDNLRARAGALRTPVLLNLALCCLKAEPAEAHRALECCEEALDLEPQNPKAMYRKAKALIELEEFREAEWELARACRLVPKDAAMRRDLEQLRQRQRDSKAREKATFEGIFERGQGFASDNRPAGGSSRPAVSDKDVKDLYFHDGEGENPYEGSLNPRRDALEAQARARWVDHLARVTPWWLPDLWNPARGKQPWFLYCREAALCALQTAALAGRNLDLPPWDASDFQRPQPRESEWAPLRLSTGPAHAQGLTLHHVAMARVGVALVDFFNFLFCKGWGANQDAQVLAGSMCLAK
ncbi:unnamed protein product, partial [Prorocentrum cordatum]